jgi:hypothetical protein
MWARSQDMVVELLTTILAELQHVGERSRLPCRLGPPGRAWFEEYEATVTTQPPRKLNRRSAHPIKEEDVGPRATSQEARDVAGREWAMAWSLSIAARAPEKEPVPTSPNVVDHEGGPNVRVKAQNTRVNSRSTEVVPHTAARWIRANYAGDRSPPTQYPEIRGDIRGRAANCVTSKLPIDSDCIAGDIPCG